MSRHASRVRSQLGDLQKLAGATEASERRILANAEKRLTDVNAQIERQRPGVEGASDAAQDRYLALVQERGQLQMIIAKAREALA